MAPTRSLIRSLNGILFLILSVVTGCSSPPPSPSGTGKQLPGQQARGTITADPNPVPTTGGLSTTRISWDTGDGSWGQVFLSAAGGAEQLFVEGPKGVQDAPWISLGAVYEFRLYAEREHRVVLSAVKVTANLEEPKDSANPLIGRGPRDTAPETKVEAHLTATPNPVPAGNGLGTTTITWDTGDGTLGQVYVYVPKTGAAEQLLTAGPRGSVDAPWIGALATYEFRLYSGQDRTRLLRTVEVTRTPVTGPHDAPFISASPKFVPAGGSLPKTLVVWDTANGSWGQVYHQVTGQPETLVDEGATGFREVSVIETAPSSFHLYAGREHTKVVASTVVPTGNARTRFLWPRPSQAIVILLSTLLVVAIGAAYARSAVTHSGRWSAVGRGFAAAMGRSGPYVVVFAGISYYLFAATRHVELPGLNYDEVLFVNAALGGVNDSFIYKQIFGIPFMVGNYMGALKAYIYFPVFRLLGVSPETIRLPIIFISMATLWVSFSMARILWGRWPGAIVAVVIATDPAFIFHARMDWGPAMLMLFFKMLALYFFFRLVQTHSVRYWLGLAASLLLGLYDKSIFIWFVLAFTLVSTMCYRKELGAFASSYLRYLAVAGLGLSVAVILLLRLVVRDVLEIQGVLLSLSTLKRRTSLIWKLFRSTMDGSATYGQVTGTELSSPSLVYPVVMIAVALLIGLVGWRVVKRRGVGSEPGATLHDRHAVPGLFFLGIGVLIFVQIVLTPQAIHAHHVMMLYPFHHLVAVSAALLSLKFALRWPPFLRVFLGVLIAVLMVSQLRAVNAHVTHFQEGAQFTPVWSPRIYTLANYLEQAAPQLDLVVIGDWAIYNQLFALASTETRAKYDETWRLFDEWKADDTDRLRWLALYSENANVAVVLHGEKAQVFPNARRNFLSFSSQFLKPADAVVDIPDRSGNPVFEVYVYRGRPR